ncbi:c2h2 transcription factor [Diplodia corticola]|uniref:C2h2 transcription factor n=1 Tax=Diplodia corticola TaxID=236234 RepID=A0A1J9RDR9_9PEZI|nr:c2h2 transcription factor [Diplodia corticola]OJD30699.1 c2h2 transcription factor [Diplodia corticola]
MDDDFNDPQFFQNFLQEVDSMFPQGDAPDDSSLLPADCGSGDVNSSEADESLQHPTRCWHEESQSGLIAVPPPVVHPYYMMDPNTSTSLSLLGKQQADHDAWLETKHQDSPAVIPQFSAALHDSLPESSNIPSNGALLSSWKKHVDHDNPIHLDTTGSAAKESEELSVIGPKVIEDGRARDGYVHENGGGYTCRFPNCKVKRLFKRKYELQRHMGIHTPTQTFDCPVFSCNRRGRYAFYREDKLKAHLKAVHSDEDQAACPVPGCRALAETFPLDLLRVHVSCHDNDDAQTIKLLKSYGERDRKCPMRNCRQKRWLSIEQIAGPKGHLMSHDEADRISQASDLRGRGYGVHGEAICPICDYSSTDIAAIQQHIESEHILTEHGRMHVNAVRSILKPYDKTYPRVWDHLPYGWFAYSCPSCPYEKKEYQSAPTDHVGIFKPSDEIYPFRRHILHLWPEFHSHPVFDDVRPTA